MFALNRRIEQQHEPRTYKSSDAVDNAKKRTLRMAHIVDGNLNVSSTVKA